MIFTEFIKLRDNLSDMAMRANGFASLASGQLDQVTSKLEYQYQGLIYSYDNVSGRVQILDDSMHILKSLRVQDLPEALGEIINNTSFTVADGLETVSTSGDLYSILALITQKYSYCGRIALTDLNYQIDQVTSFRGTNYDVQDLKVQLLSLSDKDGYITNRTWLVALQGWIQSCKDGADEERLELDNTSPSVLSGLYTIVSTVLEATLSALFAAIAVIFRSLGALLAQAFSKLFEIISTATSQSGSIDPDAVNHFVKGPCISREEPRNGATQGLFDQVSGTKHVRYTQLSSCGVFFWHDKPTNKIRINSYFAPKHAPGSTMAYLSQHGWLTIDGFELKRVAQLNGGTFNVPEATLEEQERMASDISYYCQCLCVSELVRWLRSTICFYDNSAAQVQKIKYTVPLPGTAFTWLSDPWVRAVCVGWLCCVYYTGFPGTAYDTAVVDTANLLVQDAYQQRETYSDLRKITYVESAGNWAGTQITVCRNPLIDGCIVGSSEEYRYTGINFRYAAANLTQVEDYRWVWMDIESEMFDAESLPTEFLVTFNSITSEWLTRFLVISSMAAVALSFTALKVSKAIRLKKLKKNFLRTQDIANKKAIYEDYSNPDRPGGPKTPAEVNTALNDYIKSVDKYNRMGRILGWGSYDINNAWINSPDKGSSTVSSNTATLNALQNERTNLASVTAAQTSSIIGSDSTATISRAIAATHGLIGSNPSATLSGAIAASQALIGSDPTATLSGAIAASHALIGTDSGATLTKAIAAANSAKSAVNGIQGSDANVTLTIIMEEIQRLRNEINDLAKLIR